MLVKKDPIGYLIAYSHEYLEKKKDQFMAALQAARKNFDLRKKNAAAKETELNEAMAMANELKRKSYNEGNDTWKSEMDHQHFKLLSEKITYTRETLKKRAVRLQSNEYTIKILEKLERAFDYNIQSIQMKVEYLQEDFEDAKGSAEATRSVAALFGADDHKEVFDMAVDWTEELTSNFVAETENFMNMAPTLLYDEDLRSDMSEQSVLKLLQDMDQKADAFISGGEEKKALKGRKQDVIDAEFVTVDSSKEAVPLKKNGSLLE